MDKYGNKETRALHHPVAVSAWPTTRSGNSASHKMRVGTIHPSVIVVWWWTTHMADFTMGRPNLGQIRTTESLTSAVEVRPHVYQPLEMMYRSHKEAIGRWVTNRTTYALIDIHLLCTISSISYLSMQLDLVMGTVGYARSTRYSRSRAWLFGLMLLNLLLCSRLLTIRGTSSKHKAHVSKFSFLSRPAIWRITRRWLGRGALTIRNTI